MSFVTIEQDGSISVAARDVVEAKLALRELKFQKKALNVQKKEINEQMRQIRASYTDTVRRRNSKFIGGGFLGKVIRGVQTANRDNNRHNLAVALAPCEQRKQWLEAVAQRIEQSILRVEFYISQNS